MSSLKEVHVPDLGNVPPSVIIEIPVQSGDFVQKEGTLITIEGDKASTDIPAPFAGKVKEIKVKVGDKVSRNDLIAVLEVEADEVAVQGEEGAASIEARATISSNQPQEVSIKSSILTTSTTDEEFKDEVGYEEKEDEIHAGPGVRRLAREFGIDLKKISGTGLKGRIVQEDLQNFVKIRLNQDDSQAIGLGKISPVDFTKFGDIESKPLSRIKKLTGKNLLHNWTHVPHVTQFNEADITELETFRKAQASFAKQQEIKLTLLAFVMKAVVTSLRCFPHFNASLSQDEEELIIKKYFHIGIAVDTKEGLVVPVIKNVDKKSLLELAKELGEVSQKARDGKLRSTDMQGSSFTISSLGGIGGTAFTPIVNRPDVAILGVSKAQYKPCYHQGEFLPRLLLPLSLSYDHRVIDGAEGARFIVYLSDCLSDIRRWLL